MTDIAALSFSIDSKQAKQAFEDLDKLAKAAKNVEDRQKQMQIQTIAMERQMQSMVRMQQQYLALQLQVAEASKRTADNTNTLTGKMTDLGVKIALVAGAAYGTAKAIDAVGNAAANAAQKMTQNTLGSFKKIMDDFAGQVNSGSYATQITNSFRGVTESFRALSLEAGTNSKELRDWSRHMAEINLSADTSQKIFLKVTSAMRDSGTAADVLRREYRALGIDVEKMVRNGDKQEEIFVALGKAMSRYSDDINKVNTLQRILGTSTAEVQRALKGASDGFVEISETVRSTNTLYEVFYEEQSKRERKLALLFRERNKEARDAAEMLENQAARIAVAYQRVTFAVEDILRDDTQSTTIFSTSYWEEIGKDSAEAFVRGWHYLKEAYPALAKDVESFSKGLLGLFQTTLDALFVPTDILFDRKRIQSYLDQINQLSQVVGGAIRQMGTEIGNIAVSAGSAIWEGLLATWNKPSVFSQIGEKLSQPVGFGNVAKWIFDNTSVGWLARGVGGLTNNFEERYKQSRGSMDSFFLQAGDGLESVGNYSFPYVPLPSLPTDPKKFYEDRMGAYERTRSDLRNLNGPYAWGPEQEKQFWEELKREAIKGGDSYADIQRLATEKIQASDVQIVSESFQKIVNDIQTGLKMSPGNATQYAESLQSFLTDNLQFLSPSAKMNIKQFIDNLRVMAIQYAEQTEIQGINDQAAIDQAVNQGQRLGAQRGVARGETPRAAVAGMDRELANLSQTQQLAIIAARRRSLDAYNVPADDPRRKSLDQQEIVARQSRNNKIIQIDQQMYAELDRMAAAASESDFIARRTHDLEETLPEVRKYYEELARLEYQSIQLFGEGTAQQKKYLDEIQEAYRKRFHADTVKQITDTVAALKYESEETLALANVIGQGAEATRAYEKEKEKQRITTLLNLGALEGEEDMINELIMVWGLYYDKLARANDLKQFNAEEPQIRENLAIMRKEISLMDESTAVREKQVALYREELRIRRQFPGLQEEEIQKRLKLVEEVSNEQTKLNDMAREQQQYAEMVKNTVLNIQNAFANIFADIFSSGKITFEKLTSSIKNMFIQLAAQIATLMIIRPVMGGLMNAVGLGYQAVEMGMLRTDQVRPNGGFGFFDWFGGGQTEGGAGQTHPMAQIGYQPGIFEQIGGWFSGGSEGAIAGGLPATQANVLADYGIQGAATQAGASAMPAAGASMFSNFANAGSILGIVGSAVPGIMNRNGGQAAAGVGGAIIGTMLGGPIGTMIGGTLGNIVGSLLFKKKPSVGPGQVATFLARENNEIEAREFAQDNGGSIELAKRYGRDISKSFEDIFDELGINAGFAPGLTFSFGNNQKDKFGYTVSAPGSSQNFKEAKGFESMEEAMAQMFMEAVNAGYTTGLSSNYSTALKAGQPASLQELEGVIKDVKLYEDMISTEELTNVAKATEVVEENFRKMRERAEELGLALEPLDAALKKAIDTIQKDWNDSLQAMIRSSEGKSYIDTLLGIGKNAETLQAENAFVNRNSPALLSQGVLDVNKLFELNIKNFFKPMQDMIDEIYDTDDVNVEQSVMKEAKGQLDGIIDFFGEKTDAVSVYITNLAKVLLNQLTPAIKEVTAAAYEMTKPMQYAMEDMRMSIESVFNPTDPTFQSGSFYMTRAFQGEGQMARLSPFASVFDGLTSKIQDGTASIGDFNNVLDWLNDNADDLKITGDELATILGMVNSALQRQGDIMNDNLRAEADYGNIRDAVNNVFNPNQRIRSGREYIMDAFDSESVAAKFSTFITMFDMASMMSRQGTASKSQFDTLITIIEQSGASEQERGVLLGMVNSLLNEQNNIMQENINTQAELNALMAAYGDVTQSLSIAVARRVSGDGSTASEAGYSFREILGLRNDQSIPAQLQGVLNIITQIAGASTVSNAQSGLTQFEAAINSIAALPQETLTQLGITPGILQQIGNLGVQVFDSIVTALNNVENEVTDATDVIDELAEALSAFTGSTAANLSSAVSHYDVGSILSFILGSKVTDGLKDSFQDLLDSAKTGDGYLAHYQNLAEMIRSNTSYTPDEIRGLESLMNEIFGIGENEYNRKLQEAIDKNTEALNENSQAALREAQLKDIMLNLRADYLRAQGKNTEADLLLFDAGTDDLLSQLGDLGATDKQKDFAKMVRDYLRGQIGVVNTSNVGIGYDRTDYEKFFTISASRYLERVGVDPNVSDLMSIRRIIEIGASNMVDANVVSPSGNTAPGTTVPDIPADPRDMLPLASLSIGEFKAQFTRLVTPLNQIVSNTADCCGGGSGGDIDHPAVRNLRHMITRVPSSIMDRVRPAIKLYEQSGFNLNRAMGETDDKNMKAMLAYLHDMVVSGKIQTTVLNEAGREIKGLRRDNASSRPVVSTGFRGNRGAIRLGR